MDHELCYEQQVVPEQLRGKFDIRSQQNVFAKLHPYTSIFGSNKMEKQGTIQEELSQLCSTYHLHILHVFMKGILRTLQTMSRN